MTQCFPVPSSSSWRSYELPSTSEQSEIVFKRFPNSITDLCDMPEQELQNAIGELRRQLGEAAEEKGTLTTVARQREAEVARAHAAEAAAAEEAAETGRQLAATCVQLKVGAWGCLREPSSALGDIL